jgi:hypothetical protein
MTDFGQVRDVLRAADAEQALAHVAPTINAAIRAVTVVDHPDDRDAG